jgi:hypothetical protein
MARVITAVVPESGCELKHAMETAFSLLLHLFLIKAQDGDNCELRCLIKQWICNNGTADDCKMACELVADCDCGSA